MANVSLEKFYRIKRLIDSRIAQHGPQALTTVDLCEETFGFRDSRPRQAFREHLLRLHKCGYIDRGSKYDDGQFGRDDLITITQSGAKALQLYVERKNVSAHFVQLLDLLDTFDQNQLRLAKQAIERRLLPEPPAENTEVRKSYFLPFPGSTGGLTR